MKARNVLEWLLYAGGGAYVLLFLFAAMLRLMYPYEVEWNEGAVLDHAIRVLQGKPIYASPSLDFSAFVYTPIYYYLTALVMKIGGVGLWSGRLISILSTLGTAIIAGRIVHRETASSVLTFTSFALYIAFYHVTGFFYDIVRMDALALLLVAVSIYAAMYSRRGYLVTASFAALAYFTKQQMFFIVPAIAIGLAFRDKKQAMWFSIVSVTLIFMGTVMLNWETSGWYRFYTMTIPGIKATKDFSWITALEFFPKWVFSTLGMFTLVPLVGIAMLGKKSLQGHWPILWAASVMALISSALSIGNFGGYQNVLMYNPLGEKMLFASARQQQAGDEFIAKLKSIQGEVWIPFHGYINTLAEKTAHVHYMAMNDALVPNDTTSARFQHEIDSSLAAHRFSAIILDEQKVFQWDSVAHYVPSSKIFSVPNVFISRIGEAATRPDLIYLPGHE